ncbi:MAG TPA: triphosphoribosyl-dephospho-CoA synthase [Chthoniobacterales bacterium]|nr:triphosphoribosyl-dephospho-CoA synthase [Chthoniobacterales bacterium]
MNRAKQRTAEGWTTRRDGRSVLLGALARQALIAEAELTPKPGLVDRRGSGSHNDLSLDVMRRSALAIEPFICRMAFQAANERPSASLRVTLAAFGRAAETAMLHVTNGNNAHKGAIWSLGLLAASASINQYNWDAFAITRTAAEIASFEDPHVLRHISHGQTVVKKFGVSGARGEAMEGFPHIIDVGLPMLRARRTARVPERIARLDALLSIMAQLDDTCVLYRGGAAALRIAKNGAAAVLRGGGAGSSLGEQCLRVMDLRLLELGVSPGGSADLLAATLFLDAIERDQSEIPTDEATRRDYGTVRI